jgi:hypothetical protein
VSSGSSGSSGGEGGSSEGPGAEGPELTRLDPDAPRRAPETSKPADRHEPADPLTPGSVQPVIDTRRYRWAIGIVGLVLVVVVSVVQFASHGVGTTGVPPGQRLRFFAAPLAASSLVGDPNLQPPCTPARHDPRALNICLLAHRSPLVLAFFVTGLPECVRQVDALQALAARFPASVVRFAAVAVHGGRTETARLVRSHHWTIPVAYDRDGSVGGLYGVAICPMAELADRGGIVRDRLIGVGWQTTGELAPRVRALVSAAGGDRRP